MVDVSTLTQKDKAALDSGDYGSISPEGMGIINAVDLPPVAEPKRDRTFAEGFSGAKTPEAMLGQLMESVMPLGRITNGKWLSPEEAYGPEFMQATPAQRRAAFAVLEQRRAATLDKETEATLASGAGTLLGSMVKSPATLAFPVGKGVSQGAVAGFSYGAVFDVLDQKTSTDEVDLVQSAVAGGIGGVLGGAFNFGVGKLSKLGEKAAKVQADPAKVRISNKNIARIEEATQQAVIDGVPTESIASTVATKLDMDEDLVRLFTATSSRNLNISVGESAAKIAKVQASKGTAFDDFIQPIKSRIAKWSPEIAGRLDKYEFKVRSKATEYEDVAAPFFTGFQKMSKPAQDRLSLFLMNGNYKAASKYASSQGMASSSVDAVQGLLKRIHKELKDTGVERANLDDYFVRTVKDWEGLRKAMGKKNSSPLGKMIAQHLKKAGKTEEELTQSEKNWLIDNWMKGKHVEVQSSRTAERRSFDVRQELLPFYENSTVALTNYLNKAADDVAYAEFFGAGKKTKLQRKTEKYEKVEVDDLDTEANIATILEGFEDNPEAYAEITEMLQARFNAARAPTDKTVNTLRSLGYLNTIGNPMSALTQLGDVAVTAVTQGLRPTLSALLGKNQVDLAELGIKTALDADFATVGTLTDALNTALKWSGFAKMDKFGKNTMVNASLRKNQALARKNPDALRKKWTPMFADETDDLIRDLEAGSITERVRLTLFSELAEVQPISMSEMPLKYLNHPNGRMFYMLKTFGLKQLDLLRNQVVNEAKKGNYKQAGKFASSYMALFGGAGATIQEIKHYLSGREFKLEDIPDNYISNMLGIFLLNRYMGDQLSQGKITDIGLGMILPPLDYIDSLAKDVLSGVGSVVNDTPLEEVDWELGEEIPLIGPWWNQLVDFTSEGNLTDGPKVNDRLDRDEEFRDSPLSLARPTQELLN